MLMRRGLKHLLACLAALALGLPGVPQQACAGKIDSLLLPEGTPELSVGSRKFDLLNPKPFVGSWAEPGHRPLGVNFNNYDLTQAQIDAAKATGCGMVRIELPMERFISQAEPDWAVLDVVVSRLGRAGLEVVPVLTAKSVVPQFFREFCAAVAARYAKSFHYYQILDNVNLQPGLYTRDYVELLIKARLAIVMADGDAVIVTGGVRGADLTYLDMLENQGALDFFDVVAFNIYPPMAGIEGTVDSQRADHCIPYFEKVCAWAAARNKGVWVTSFGMSTAIGDAGVDQLDQASAYARGALWLGWFGVERIFFAAIQDADPAYAKPALCCGLLDVSGRPKASYLALRSLNNAVSNAYHIQPEFSSEGAIYQVPDPEVLLALPPGEQPEFDPFADYMLHGLKTYGFWFYEPSLQEYRLVYWLERDLVYDVVVSVGLGLNGLEPLESSQLLDPEPAPLEGQSGSNLMAIGYVPISTMPGVLRFKVEQDGQAS